MALTTTLLEVGKAPGTAKQIAARCNGSDVSIAVELSVLYSRGKVTRTKIPQEKGRAVYEYRVADEAGSQA